LYLGDFHATSAAETDVDVDGDGNGNGDWAFGISVLRMGRNKAQQCETIAFSLTISNVIYTRTYGPHCALAVRFIGTLL